MLIALVFSQPVFGESLVPQSTSIPTDTSISVQQPISVAPDGWSPVGDTSGSCEAARSRASDAGADNVTLTSSGTSCSDTRSLALALQSDRLSLFAGISATQAAMSLSTGFNVALQYRPTDALKIGIQETTVAEASVVGILGTSAMFVGPTDTLSAPLASHNAIVTRISSDYGASTWSIHAALATGSSFMLETFQIKDQVSRNWTADIAVEHTVAGPTTLDAGELAISGRIDDVSVGLTYLQAPPSYVFEPDSILHGMTKTDTPILSIGASLWGWQWALKGLGGPMSGLTLTAERSQPHIGVTISPDPFGIWLKHNSQF